MYGRFALSFKTRNGSDTVYYLVPDDDEERIGLKETTVPVYAFTLVDISSDPLSDNQQTKC